MLWSVWGAKAVRVEKHPSDHPRNRGETRSPLLARVYYQQGVKQASAAFFSLLLPEGSKIFMLPNNKHVWRSGLSQTDLGWGLQTQTWVHILLACHASELHKTQGSSWCLGMLRRLDFEEWSKRNHTSLY